jgi:hypothetical protein
MKGYLLSLEEDSTRTLGRLLLFNGITPVATFTTLELPWRDNKRNISRIPAGEYDVVPHKSMRHGDCYAIKHVHGRDGILIHVLNFPYQTEGCVGIGMDFSDVDGDKRLDIINSRMALNELKRKAPNGFKLTVIR